MFGRTRQVVSLGARYQRFPIIIIHRTHGHHHHGLSTNKSFLEKNEQARETCERVTKLGMISNIFLVVTKGIAGIIGNSSAMVADAVHSLSDLASDIVTLVIVKHVRKPYSSKYPYGYGKFESLGSLTLSGLLFGTGVGILWSSVKSMLAQFKDHLPGFVEALLHDHSEELTAGPTSIALFAAILSIIVKEWNFRFTLEAGKKYNSTVVIANAYHHRSDAYSSIVALLGIAGSMLFNITWLDPLAGAVVAVMIGKTSYSLGIEAIQELTDHQLTNEIRNDIGDTIQASEGVVAFHRLRVRKMGPFCALDVHIVVDSKMSVSASHQVAERVRHEIREKFEEVTDILVHVDPAEEDLHPEDDKKVTEQAEAQGTVHYTLPPGYLKRPQNQVYDDVNSVVSTEFKDDITSVGSFTCHYLNGQLIVELEVVMQTSLTISEAHVIAVRLRETLITKIHDVDDVDVRLALIPKSN